MSVLLWNLSTQRFGPCQAASINISDSSSRRTSHSGLNFDPYKIQVVQESKSRINPVVNFWLVWTQAWRSQTVCVWSSWLSSFQIRKRTLLVLGKQNVTNSYARNHYIVRRAKCDMRYNLSGYWPEFFPRRWQYSGHGNISPRVWHLLHPSVNSTAQVKGNECRRKYKRRRQSVVSKFNYAGKSEELSNLVDF
jgi:hypothetical protein